MNSLDSHLIVFLFIVFIIEIYAETHTLNYGTLVERFIFLFSAKNCFIIFKFSTLFSFGILFFVPEISTVVMNLNVVPQLSFFFLPLISAIFILFLNSKNIFYQLRANFFRSRSLNQLRAVVEYVLWRLASFSLAYVLFVFIYKGVHLLHSRLTEMGLALFDWLLIAPNDEDNYNKGVYFSILLTICVFFLFNNSLIKKNRSEFWNNRLLNFVFFKYFFISLILSVGLFFGIFSILNGIYNLRSFGAAQWINEENILGIFPIRISSILITFYLLQYIYNEVLHQKPWHFLALAFLPLRSIDDFNENINFYKTETLFFSQISFYILNTLAPNKLGVIF